MKIHERVIAYGMLLLLCGATALPLSGMQKRDSFPVSTYPMFAGQRGHPTFHRLVAVLEDGSRLTVPPEHVASTEVLQTKVLITRTVRRGNKAMRRLCQEVAGNIERDTRFAGARRVEIEEVRFDSIRYFTEAREPIAAKILARCPIRTEVSP